MFSKVLKRYPDIFKEKLIDEGLFYNVYGQVCSRCFGYGLPTCAMVPMGDNINHSSISVTNEVINLEKQLNGTCRDASYFT